MKLYTTLNEIKKHRPCKSGWTMLLKSLDKTKADDERLGLMTILESNGIKDAIWCLKCFDYLDYCLSGADVAELVLPIFEKYNKTDKRPRKAIAAIRDYHANKITEEQLLKVADAAYAAADAGAADGSYAAYAAAYTAAASAAAYTAASYAADAAYADVADADAAAAAQKNKWIEIEQVFIKHFN